MSYKKIFFLIYTVFALSGCASSSSIDGVWRSDKNATIGYLKNYAKLTDSEYIFMERNVGHTYFVFKKGMFCRFVEGYSDGVRENPPMKIMSRFRVKKYQYSFHVVEVLSEIGIFQYAFPVFFNRDDAFWVLTGWDEKFIGGREYYTRVSEDNFKENHDMEDACK